MWLFFLLAALQSKEELQKAKNQARLPDCLYTMLWFVSFYFTNNQKSITCFKDRICILFFVIVTVIVTVIVPYATHWSNATLIPVKSGGSWLNCKSNMWKKIYVVKKILGKTFLKFFSLNLILLYILNYFYHFQPFLYYKKCAYLKEVIRPDFDQCEQSD